MKLSDAIAASDAYSGKTSDIVRQKSLAGIALIWVFKSGSADHPRLDVKLVRAALFIAVALIIDLFQYLSSYMIWNSYIARLEREGKVPDDEVFPSPRIFFLNDLLFYSKAVAMMVAYAGFLGPYLLWEFSAHT